VSPPHRGCEGANFFWSHGAPSISSQDRDWSPGWFDVLSRP
jgi:hypothetical protein